MWVRIDKADKGCCSEECEFKKQKYCNLFGEKLHGDYDNPTRTYKCYNSIDGNKDIQIIKVNTSCAYQNEEFTLEFLKNKKAKPCKKQCPVNPETICYRWDICFIGKKI